jgi:orotidine-5'-phosphate decarboxylase
VRTSNPGARDVEDLPIAAGGTVWEHVAGIVDRLGARDGAAAIASVGAVVGATVPEAVAEARHLLPQAVLLLPGVGAQGASPADVARAFTSGPASALVAASRSVTYGFRQMSEDWRTGAAREAARLKSEIWAASGW